MNFNYLTFLGPVGPPSFRDDVRGFPEERNVGDDAYQLDARGRIEMIFPPWYIVILAMALKNDDSLTQVP